MEHFLHSLKAGSAGVLKEIHSLVRDGRDRKQVNNKTNKSAFVKESYNRSE